MGRKKPRGICRICGEYKKLSFEHVPPGATFNKQAVKFVTLRDFIEAEKSGDVLPWELEKVKGTINQRGRGGYYICEQCNNNTGSWYAVHYKKFVNALMYVMHKGLGPDYKSVTLEIMEMRPLPIIKQIVTMFCDINENLTNNDPKLRSFIMNKESNDFDTDKYRIYMYLLKGGVERTAPLSAMIHLGEPETVMASPKKRFSISNTENVTLGHFSVMAALMSRIIGSAKCAVTMPMCAGAAFGCSAASFSIASAASCLKAASMPTPLSNWLKLS